MRQLTDRPAPVSARTRIVGWMALVVSLALVVLVVVVGRVVLIQADAALGTELRHEGHKLRAFAARGVDPDTGAPLTSAARALDAFLADNLPEDDETFFSVVDGRARSRSPQPPPARVDLDASVVRAAAAARSPVTGSADTAAGPIRYAVYPVRVAGDPSTAALVVVEFARDGRDRAWRLVRLVAAVGALALALALIVSWAVAGRALAPIRTLREAADRIGETDTLGQRIRVSGDDEVAALASTFNRMLDRLEDAFDGQRRFLDDASHELRTPLTVVRGHLELMQGEPEVERARSTALVLDELDRMTRLVDDLLLLASAERPDFLRPGQVDVTDLVVEVAAKARPLGRRRWKVDELVEATVVADAQRLTQALLQLAANAVQHTSEDDEVALGASRRPDGAVEIWVRDTGSGIAAAEQEGVFQRAARGAGRDTGDRSGLGLGLAIVSSIVRAHGGTVRLDSAVGVGSRFTIVLPQDGERP